MNTSLFLPAAARYWSSFRSDRDHRTFVNAICALTSFVILRRAATGITSGIDSNFRDLMNSDKTDPICAGLVKQNTLPTIEALKNQLRFYLEKSTVEVTDKASWIERVRSNPLATQSKPLARFLLLAAADGCLPDEKSPGLWRREGVIPSSEREYLSFDWWQNGPYRTIEHVAPQSANQGDWDRSIYEDSFLRHTLGNLVLLPQEENSAAGKSGWQKKGIFYRAFSEKDKEGRERCQKDAEDIGFEFTKKFQEILKNGRRLHMLDPVRNVEEWDRAFIRVRTENIAGLAWDRIAPWLFD